MLIINMKKVSTVSIGIFLILLPVFANAQGSVNSPGTTNTGITYDCAVENSGRAQGECTFQDLILAVQKVVKWVTIFALEFSVVVIAWAGFKYMTSGDNASKRKEANDMLVKVGWGIAYILAAWLIVTLVLKGLQVTVPTFLG